MFYDFTTFSAICVKVIISMAAKQLGNLSKHLRELRFHLCQKSSSSQGFRNFIEREYVGIKQANPNFPILIRECSNVEPKIYARYGKGVEQSISVPNQSSDEIVKSIMSLLKPNN